MTLNTSKIVDYARKNTPDIPVTVIKGSKRHNVIDALHGAHHIGIELGVARGVFSKRMIDSGKFKKFFGVDAYGDGDIHNTDEYKTALQTVGLDQNYSLLRMTFEEALDLFPDHYFDFVYIDGFAHTGEEGGQTLYDWFKKVKPGGIIAGDDYHDDWPLVQWAVNDFAKNVGAQLNLTDITEDNAYSLYPSWFLTKPEGITDKDFTPNPHLTVIANQERVRINKKRQWHHSRLRLGMIRLLDCLKLKTVAKKILGSIR